MNSKTGFESAETCTANKIERGNLKQGDKTYPLYDGLNLIGRDTKATVYVQNETIDSHHAIITILSETSQYISDFKSSHGTTLDNQLLTPFKLYNLQDGMSVKFGDVQMTYMKSDSLEQDADDDDDDATQLLEPRQDPTLVDDIHDAPTQYMAFDMSDCANKKEADMHELPTQVFDFSNRDVCGTSKTCSAVSTPASKGKVGKLGDVDGSPLSKNCPSTSASNGTATENLGDVHELPTQVFEFDDSDVCETPKKFSVSTPVSEAKRGNLTGDVNELPTLVFPPDNDAQGDVSTNGSVFPVSGNKSRDVTATRTTTRGDLAAEDESSSDSVDFMTMQKAIDTQCLSKENVPDAIDNQPQCSQVQPVKKRSKNPLDSDDEPTTSKSPEANDSSTDIEDLHDERSKKIATLEETDKKSDDNSNQSDNFVSQVQPVARRSKNPLDSDTDIEDFGEADQIISQVQPVKKRSKNPLDSDTDIEDLHEPGKNVEVANTMAQKSNEAPVQPGLNNFKAQPELQRSKDLLGSDLDDSTVVHSARNIESDGDSTDVEDLNDTLKALAASRNISDPTSDVDKSFDLVTKDPLLAGSTKRRSKYDLSDSDNENNDMDDSDIIPCTLEPAKNREVEIADSFQEDSFSFRLELSECMPLVSQRNDANMVENQATSTDLLSNRQQSNILSNETSNKDNAKTEPVNVDEIVENRATSSGFSLNQQQIGVVANDISKTVPHKSTETEKIATTRKQTDSNESTEEYVKNLDQLKDQLVKKAMEIDKKMPTQPALISNSASTAGCSQKPSAQPSKNEVTTDDSRQEHDYAKFNNTQEMADHNDVICIEESQQPEAGLDKRSELVNLGTWNKKSDTDEKLLQTNDVFAQPNLPSAHSSKKVPVATAEQKPPGDEDVEDKLQDLFASQRDFSCSQLVNILADGGVSPRPVVATFANQSLNMKLSKLASSGGGKKLSFGGKDDKENTEDSVMRIDDITSEVEKTTDVDRLRNAEISDKTSSATSGADRRNGRSSPKPSTSKASDEPDLEDQLDMMFASQKVKFTEHDLVNILNTTVEEPKFENNEAVVNKDKTSKSKELELTKEAAKPSINGDIAVTKSKKNGGNQSQENSPPGIDCPTAKVQTKTINLEQASTSSSLKPKQNKHLDKATSEITLPVDKGVEKLSRNAKNSSRDNSPARIKNSTAKVRENITSLVRKSSSSDSETKSTQVKRKEGENTKLADRNVSKLSKNQKNSSRDSSPSGSRKATSKTDGKARNSEQTGSSSKQQESKVNEKQPNENQSMSKENPKNKDRHDSPVEVVNSSSSSKKQESKANEKQVNENQTRSKRNPKNKDRADSPVEVSNNSSSSKNPESKVNEKQANESKARSKGNRKNKDRDDSPAKVSDSSSSSKNRESKANEKQANETQASSKGNPKTKDGDNSPVEVLDSKATNQKDVQPLEGNKTQNNLGKGRRNPDDSPNDTENPTTKSQEMKKKLGDSVANENKQKTSTSGVDGNVRQSKRNVDLEKPDTKPDNATASKLPTKQHHIDLTNSDSNDDLMIIDDRRTVLKRKSPLLQETKNSEIDGPESSKTNASTSAVVNPKNISNTVDRNEHLEEIKKVISESIRDVQQKEAISSKKKSVAASSSVVRRPSRADDVTKPTAQAKADSKILTRTRSGDIDKNSTPTTPVKRSTRSTANVTPIINLIANETRASTRSSTRTRDRLELLELLDKKTKTEDFNSEKSKPEDSGGPSPPKKRRLSDSEQEEPPVGDKKDKKIAEVDSKGDLQKKEQKEPPATKTSENSVQSTAGDQAVDLFGIRARNSALKPTNLIAISHEDESSQDSAKSEISMKSTTSTRSTTSHSKSKTVRKTRGSIIDLVDDDMKITVPQNRTRTSSIVVAQAPTVEALEVTASTSKGRMSTRSKPVSSSSKSETTVLSSLPEDKVHELPSTSSSLSDLSSSSTKPAPRGRKLSANSRRLRALQGEQEENSYDKEEDVDMKSKLPSKRLHQQKDKEELDDVVVGVTTSKRRKKDSVSSNEGTSSSNASARIDMPSTPERSRRRLKPKVVFTMMDNPELESLIRQLGGSVVDSVECCTVLVTEHVKRTCKLLSAVGQAKPICSPKWLTECRKASTFLDPWDYVLVDKEAEKKWNFSLLESLQRSAAEKLMAGYTFHIMVNVANDVLKGAIESCGGKVVSKIMGKIDPEKYFIVASPENKAKYSRVVKSHPGLRVIEPEAIFDGTLRQELHFEQHLLPV